MRTITTALLAALFLAISVVSAEEWNQLDPKQTAAGYELVPVANGIWRLRFGSPEKFVPTAYLRSAPIDEKGLADMTAAPRLPWRPANILAYTTGRGTVFELPMQKDEQVYGMGNNIAIFNQTNRRSVIRASDMQPIPANDKDKNVANEQNDAHAAVPFYVSNLGYGVFVDSARYLSFYAGNVALVRPDQKPQAESDNELATDTDTLYRRRELSDKTMVIDIPGAVNGADIYIFAGPSMMEAIQRYNLFSGGGALPPLWGLGVAFRSKTQYTQEMALKLAKEFREEKMPCDMWGFEPGWHTKAYSCSFVWNKERFPDPVAMIQEMNEMGYRINLWEHAFIHPTAPFHKEIMPWSGNYMVWGGLVPDFATPEAKKIYLDYHNEVLIDIGIEGFKIDECDNQPLSWKPWSFPEASRFPSGMDGEIMHAMFGQLTQKLFDEEFRKRNKRTYNQVRATHALASPLPFVVYSDLYKHDDYIRAIGKSGFCGTLWTPELRQAKSAEDMIRRMQSLVFSALAQVDCWFLDHPPWYNFDRNENNAGKRHPDSEAHTKAMRDLMNVRMTLVPYLYSAFMDYHRKGIPPHRAIVVDYPNDKETFNLDMQFFVGPSLLVAPVLAGQQSCEVYLPKGEWFDFWTKKKYAGGQKIKIDVPLETIPVFVKSGTIVPLAEPVQCITKETCFDVTVHVFGKGDTPFVLYEDDGETFDYAGGQQRVLKLTWQDGQGIVSQTGTWSENASRYKINSWQHWQ